MWKWFDTMDVFYGHRPASRGRETGEIDRATSLLESMLEPTGEEPHCLTRPSLRTCGQAIAGAQPNVQRHHQGRIHQSQWSLLPYATPPIHGLFPLPKEVGPVTLQGAYGTCRHPTRSGWTVDSGSLEEASTLDSMRMNEQGSRWCKWQHSTQPSSKPSARWCRCLAAATLCCEPGPQP